MAGESPASILYDSEGNPVKVMIDGSLYSLSVRDIDQTDTLEKVLLELRKINMFISIMMGQKLEDSDIGED